jgi:protein-tyrosine phosphatase
MIKVLMVCLGNICRSPLAEGILKSKVNRNKVLIDSAGTGGWHIGSLPDKRSIEVAFNYDIDITNQRCRKFVASDFNNFDIIYVMDESNYNDVISLAIEKKDEGKVKMIRDEILSTQGLDIPDPYYGGESGFDYVYQMLDELCDVIAKKLNSESKLW